MKPSYLFLASLAAVSLSSGQGCTSEAPPALTQGAAVQATQLATDTAASVTATASCEGIRYSASGTSSAGYTDRDTVKYQIQLTARTTYTIRTCGGSSTDTYLRLHAAGRQVASSDDACGAQSSITYTPTSSGTYELSLGCYGSTSCSATLSVAPSATCTGPVGTCAPSCTGDRCGQADGCGGSCGADDARSCGKCGNPSCCSPACAGAQCGQPDGCGGLCPSADSSRCGVCGNAPCGGSCNGIRYSASGTSSAAYTDPETVKYQIQLTAGTSYTISTCGGSSTDTYLRLHAAGRQVASNDDACGAQSTLRYTPSTSGTYELSLGCYSATSCSAAVSVSPDATCTLPGGTQGQLRSAYLSGDTEAQQFVTAGGTFALATTGPSPVGDLGWRIINAMRMAGYDNAGVRSGEMIDGARLLQIDSELLTAEATIARQAAKLPNYQAISGPNFRDNIPQAFAAHLLVSILELYNAGTTRYQTVSNECVLANLIPQMCGALVDMGVASGSSDCKTSTAVLRQNQIVQMPELFGFLNVRRAITNSEYPTSGDFSTMAYASTLIHEFVHDLDATFASWAPMHAQYDRRTLCSPTLIDFQQSGTPFVFTGANGSQRLADFVSEYAAGLSNPGQDYRPIEDAAETVTAYILLPEYFRLRAAGSTSLRAKYDYIKARMFGGVEFQNPNLVVASNYVTPSTVQQWSLVNEVRTFRITDIRVKQ